MGIPLKKRHWPVEVGLLLGLLILLLFCFQYTTIAKFGVLLPGLSYQTLPNFMDEVNERIDFDLVDILLSGVILAICTSLVALEFWKRRLSVFLAYILGSEKRTLCLLAFSSLVFVRFYFSRGEVSWSADASVSIAYARIAAETIARGEIPIWTNYFGSGSPYLQYYGFLFFYSVGLLDLLCRDIYLSLKLILAGSHVASGMGMYFLVRIACRSRRAGFLAGLAYVLSFWHTQQVIIMGRLPVSLFYALLPWPFYFFERLRLPGRRLSAAVGGSTSLALLAFTHPGYAFWATVFFTLYAALRLGSSRGSKVFLPMLKGSLSMLVGGVVLGAYLTLSMWLEKESTGLYGGIDYTSVPDPTWLHVLSWSNFRFWLLPLSSYHWYGGYLGLSVVVLALIGLLGPIRFRFRSHVGPFLAGGACLIAAAVLVFGYRLPFMQVRVVQALNSGRYLLFAVFFLAIMAGVGTKVVVLGFGKKGLHRRMSTLMLIILIADLGPTTFQHPYLRPGSKVLGYPLSIYESMHKEALSYHHRGELPNYRIIWVRGDLNPFLTLGRSVFLTRTPSPCAPSAHNLRAVPTFCTPFERFANSQFSRLTKEDDLFSAEHIDVICDGFFLLNTKYSMITLAENELKVFEWTHFKPIVVSSRIVESPAEKIDGLISQEKNRISREERGFYPIFWLIAKMGVNRKESTCDRLFLMDFKGKQDLGTTPKVEVLKHRVWNQRVEMRVRTSAVCFARLAYAYSPYLKVTVNGQAVEPLRTAGWFMALKLDAGEHRIVLEPFLSPLRRGLLSLDLILLAGAVWGVIRGRTPKRRRIQASRSSS